MSGIVLATVSVAQGRLAMSSCETVDSSTSWRWGNTDAEIVAAWPVESEAATKALVRVPLPR
jgi:hypothetical protein